MIDVDLAAAPGPLRWVVLVRELPTAVTTTRLQIVERLRQYYAGKVTMLDAWLDLGSNYSRVTLELFRIRDSQVISIEEAWTALCVMIAICVWLLWKKIRAYEVIR